MTQSQAWLALLIFNEATSAEPVSIVAKAVNIGAAWAPLIVLSGGASMIIVEVPMVFADKIINYRHRRAREEGREEGILRERARWEQYLNELEEARAAGKPDPERPKANANGSAHR